ncbi:MAG: response regulator [Pelosinus sp.]|nr:response regulator [Pelosinus sp.]
MRVLIVDDSSLVRMQMKRVLLDNFIDIEFAEAASGIEALEKHRRFKPEVIILDYIIPPPDGLAVLKILKGFDKQVKIIIVTTLGKQKFIYNKMLDSGALAVFAKPITREVLIEIICILQKSIGTGEKIEENSR